MARFKAAVTKVVEGAFIDTETGVKNDCIHFLLDGGEKDGRLSGSMMPGMKIRVGDRLEFDMDGDWVSKVKLLPDARKYVAWHGERYLGLIEDALLWLGEREPLWGLDVPIDRGRFIEDLVESVTRD